MFHAGLILQIEPQSFARLIRTHRCEERSVLLVSFFNLRTRNVDLAERELAPQLLDRHTARRGLRFREFLR